MAKEKQTISLYNEESLEQSLIFYDEQPYEIPYNWLWTRFSDVCVVENGFAFKSDDYKDNGIPLVRISDIRDGIVDISNCVHIKVDNGYNRFVIKKGDLLIALSGATTGKNGLYLLDVPAYLNQRVGNIKVKNELLLLPDYRNYYIQDKNQEILQRAYGGAQPNISPKLLGKMFLPLPPLPEQQRIVDRIESLFEKLDQAKDLVQSALDTFQTRKAAILHKAFTGELTQKWRKENGVGMDSWIEIKLKDCGEWYGGGTPSKMVARYWIDGDIMWVTPKDMKSKYIEDTIDHITDVGVQESSASLIEKPAILFVVRSGILRRILPIAITLQKITVNQDIKVVVPNNIELEYLYWFCVCKEKSIREVCSKNGTTVESINTEALLGYPIVLPSIPEQKVVVRILNDLFEKEQQAKELYDVTEKIDLIKKAILARAFRGELGTNDPTEPSSMELLKEILVE